MSAEAQPGTCWRWTTIQRRGSLTQPAAHQRTNQLRSKSRTYGLGIQLISGFGPVGEVLGQPEPAAYSTVTVAG